MTTNVKGNEYPQLKGISTYISAKISTAKPMNRLEYNEFRDCDLPADEDGTDEGYIVQRTDGYISWSPKRQFEKDYKNTDGLNFGLAIEAMKKGYKVCRTGWNGKDMFLFLVMGVNLSSEPTASIRYLS